MTTFFTTPMNTTRKTNVEICKTHGITEKTLQAWKNEGIDVYNDEAMAERAARKHGASGNAMSEARLKKLQAEARSATMKADQLAGKLIELQEVEHAFTRLGAVAKSLLMRMQADLPPMLEGQSPSRMSQIIGEAIHKVLTQMSDPQFTEWKK
jgi:hypothetical protein